MSHNTSGVKHWQQPRAIVCLAVSGCSVTPSAAFPHLTGSLPENSACWANINMATSSSSSSPVTQNQTQTLAGGIWFHSNQPRRSLPPLSERAEAGNRWTPISSHSSGMQNLTVETSPHSSGSWNHGERCPGDRGNVREPARPHRGGSQHRDADVAGDSVHWREHHRDGDPLRGLVDELLPAGQHSDAV